VEIIAAHAVPTVRTAAALFDFQMWCWGQDVHHERGNLLLAGGLERVRPPVGEDGSTLYRALLPSGDELLLWGFALVCTGAATPALLLKRHSFTLRAVEPARLPLPLWRPTQLPRGNLVRDPQTVQLFSARFRAAAAWIAAYERGVVATVGAEWRHECARRRPRAVRHRVPAAPERLAEAWDGLAASIDRFFPAAFVAAPDTLAS